MEKTYQLFSDRFDPRYHARQKCFMAVGVRGGVVHRYTIEEPFLRAALAIDVASGLIPAERAEHVARLF